MYDPLKQIDKAFRKGPSSEKFKRTRPHPVLGWFELAAFLSFLPSMLIFLYGFLLSAAAALAAHEIEKGRYTLATTLLAIFNLLPAVVGVLTLAFEEYQPKALALALVYGILAVWGFLAIHFQKNRIPNP